MFAVLVLEKGQKLCSFFQIMPNLMLLWAQSARASGCSIRIVLEIREFWSLLVTFLKGRYFRAGIYFRWDRYFRGSTGRKKTNVIFRELYLGGGWTIVLLGWCNQVGTIILGAGQFECPAVLSAQPGIKLSFYITNKSCGANIRIRMIWWFQTPLQ